MLHFCTYFDQHYLLHGLTLYQSLEEHAESFCLHVLCLDHKTYSLIKNLGLPNLRPIALEDFERGDEALQEAKTNRSTVEYYFTCTPSLPLYVMNHFAGADMVTYLDSDLFFFSSPQPIYDGLGENSTLIIGHRYYEKRRKFGEQYGRYNVGCLVFRNDPAGRACLEWWRDRCNEWCYDIVEEHRFSDQKYLDEFPSRFPGVTVLEHKGANLARWNCRNYKLQLDNETVSVDGHPLIFYHFNSFRIVNRWIYDVDFVDWKLGKSLSTPAMRFLYEAYIRKIEETWSWIESKAPDLRLELTNLRSGSTSFWRLLSLMMRRELIYSVRSSLFF